MVNVSERTKRVVWLIREVRALTNSIVRAREEGGASYKQISRWQSRRDALREEIQELLRNFTSYNDNMPASTALELIDVSEPSLTQPWSVVPMKLGDNPFSGGVLLHPLRGSFGILLNEMPVPSARLSKEAPCGSVTLKLHREHRGYGYPLADCCDAMWAGRRAGDQIWSPIMETNRRDTFTKRLVKECQKRRFDTLYLGNASLWHDHVNYLECGIRMLTVTTENLPHELMQLRGGWPSWLRVQGFE